MRENPQNSIPVGRKRVSYPCEKCNALTDAFTSTARHDQQLCRQCFGKRKDHRPRELNDLSGAQWARYSLSIQEYPDTRTEKQRLHGACYPVSLAKQYIEKYTKKGDVVFDPFAGVGTTHDACVELERQCLGTEINESFCEMARNDFPLETTWQYAIHADDAINMDRYVRSCSIDFILTSPPYSGLLKKVKKAFAYKWKEHSKIASIRNPDPYSQKGPGDLGNMSYVDFFSKTDMIMAKLYSVLKQGKYMVWVVKDYRDLQSDIPYVNFHGDVIESAAKNNFYLWDIVIYDQTKFRPLVCLGYPSTRYYHNIGHSYILVFRKGNRGC